ncbi:MAG: hypothetical protein M3M96_06730, partial [Candidatus Eremiobacteraeota bacterium]|nr:hypothetical protein [Candidatus Eremiobacteraeota bacterium]
LENDYEIYRLVVLAWGELLEVRDKASELLARHQGILHIQRLQLNRVYLNFVATAKASIEHMGISLGRRFGKDSSQRKEFERVINAAYDSSSAYRLLDKLRNYVIHYALPIRGIHSSTFQATRESEPENTLRVVFSREVFLAAEFWSARVRADLKAGPAEIDAIATGQEYYLSVLAIADARFSYDHADAAAAVVVIERYENELRAPLHVWIALVPDEFGSHTGEIRLRPIPRGFCAAVRDAVAANTLQAMIETSLVNRQVF